LAGDGDSLTVTIIEQLLEAIRRPEVTLIVATHGKIPPEITGRVFAMKSGTLIPESPG
jgi:ABC-type lipoprotein export system ATPase subunit